MLFRTVENEYSDSVGWNIIWVPLAPFDLWCNLNQNFVVVVVVVDFRLDILPSDENWWKTQPY